MVDSSLKRKHGLSYEEIQSAFQRCAGQEASRAREKRMNWTCPACGAPQSHAMEECPRCGIIVSKFSERKRVDSDCRALSTTWQTQPAASTATWITVAGSLILCLVLAVALVKWVGSNNHRNEAKLSQGPADASPGLKKFTVDNLQKEVVDVSRNQPVLIEFYSSG
jgi:hypothetical protein